MARPAVTPPSYLRLTSGDQSHGAGRVQGVSRLRDDRVVIVVVVVDVVVVVVVVIQLVAFGDGGHLHGGPAVGRDVVAHPGPELRAHEVVLRLGQVLEAVVHQGAQHELLDAREVVEAAVLLQVVQHAAVQARVANEGEDVLDLLLVRQALALHEVSGRHQDQVLFHVAAVAGDEAAHGVHAAVEPALRADQAAELTAQQAVGRLLHVALEHLVLVQVAHGLQAEARAGVGRGPGVGRRQDEVGRGVVVADALGVVVLVVVVVVVRVVGSGGAVGGGGWGAARLGQDLQGVGEAVVQQGRHAVLVGQAIQRQHVVLVQPHTAAVQEVQEPAQHHAQGKAQSRT